MDQNLEIQQLKEQVRELLDWKAQKTRQQITYPLDVESLPALTQHYVKKIVQGTTKLAGLENTTIFSNKPSSRTIQGGFSVGDETIDKSSGSTSSLNTQFFIEDQPDSSSFDSFIFAYRKPNYILPAGSTVTVTNGTSTLTDSTKNWATDELANAFIAIINSSGVHQFTRQIASNTSTVITINGTWPSGVSDATYLIFEPVYLGSAQTPWRRLFVGGDDYSSTARRFMRIGYGTTGGTETLGMFFGTGSPESAVTANVGSLYLRTDGGASTTLYVKTSGTSNTGWTAK